MAEKGIVTFGLEEVLANFDTTIKIARNANRQVIHEIAEIITDRSKMNLSANSSVDTGRLKRAIYAKKRRPRNPDRPFSDVRVKHGADVPKDEDAWYWHFIEYGTVSQPARPFIKPAADSVRMNITQIYRGKLGKQIEKRMARRARRFERRGKALRRQGL